jgi:hypothetical protein
LTRPVTHRQWILNQLVTAEDDHRIWPERAARARKAEGARQIGLSPMSHTPEAG